MNEAASNTTANDQTTPMAGRTAGHDAPTIYPATVSAPPRRSPWRLTSVALILTLLLGAIGGGWLVSAYRDGRLPLSAAQPPVRTPAPAPVAPPPAVVVAAPAPSLSAADTATIAARVRALEDRLAQINTAAQSASGNAARAESLLVAFAARRAVERGFPLGVMEAQLRLRFGDTQPNAVNSILSASVNPVTLDRLRERLSAIRPLLLADSGQGWFTRMGNRLSTLIVIRRADAPVTSASDRFDHALRAVENGQLDAAIADVEALPGHTNPLAQAWVNDARRINDARRALDIIETAAILEPAENRTPAGNGGA